MTVSPKSTRRTGILIVAGVLIAAGVIIAAAALLLPRGDDKRYEIEGNSMEPTLLRDDVVRVDVHVYDQAQPQRDDLVAFHLPSDGSVYVKRVVGLPGETLIVDDGVIYVDNARLEELYLGPDMITLPATGRWIVPEKAYFLIGDNRSQSADSRSYGAITYDLIIGKVVAIVNPRERRREFP